MTKIKPTQTIRQATIEFLEVLSAAHCTNKTQAVELATIFFKEQGYSLPANTSHDIFNCIANLRSGIVSSNYDKKMKAFHSLKGWLLELHVTYAVYWNDLEFVPREKAKIEVNCKFDDRECYVRINNVNNSSLGLSLGFIDLANALRYLEQHYARKMPPARKREILNWQEAAQHQYATQCGSNTHSFYL